MSRVGKKPIQIPEGVTVKVDGNRVETKGPKGTLGLVVKEPITIKVEGSSIIVERPNDTRNNKALHGLNRSLLANIVEGVTKGFEKKLELHGVGFRATPKGDGLSLAVGFSHHIVVDPPEGISFEISKKQTEITVRGIDKQLVGQVAANIKQYKKVEPYKGKGIRYKGEQIIRKAGKTVAAGK